MRHLTLLTAIASLLLFTFGCGDESQSVSQAPSKSKSSAGGGGGEQPVLQRAAAHQRLIELPQRPVTESLLWRDDDRGLQSRRYRIALQ